MAKPNPPFVLTTILQSPPLSTQSTLAPKQNDYHVLSYREKYPLVIMVSMAALFSPLASNIYFPALNQIAADIGATHQAVALTVTTYMIAQGLAPSLWGPMADCVGRRQILLYTLTLFLLSNIGLALSPNVAMLIVFRFLQAAGSSSTVSIGAGVIADIAPADERGGFLGLFAGMRQFSTAIGPVIGGVIAGTLGYRYIFWLLTLMGAVTLILLFVFFPETLRTMTGNGSIPLKGWQFVPLVKTLAPWEKSTAIRTEKDELPPREKMTPSMFLQPMLFLLEKDVACTLFYGAVIYAVFSMVSASTSVLLAREFGLSTLQIGLCFLPNGLGCVFGATISGRQLDKDFRLAETQYKYENDLPRHYRLPKGNQPADFPLETTRLAQVPTMTAAFCFAVVIYGFGIANGGSLVIPLAAQFVIGYSSTAVLNLNNTLTVDLYPGKSAAATAVNNLARCLVGALGVSFTDMALEKMPAEYFFVALAGSVLLATPMAWAEAKYGIQWRCQRMKKIQEKKENATASHA